MELKDVLSAETLAKVEAEISEHNAKADKTKKVKFVDLSEGGYVSKDKYDDKTAALQNQINDLTAQIKTRDSDLADFRGQLEAANGDKTKLAEVQAKFADLQNQYTQEKTDWETRLKKQTYESLVKEQASLLSFSSNAAKKAFIHEAIEKDFKVDGETLLGFTDWLTKYKESDPAAFASDNPAPSFGAPSTPAPNSGQKMTLDQMMARANMDPNFIPNFE